MRETVFSFANRGCYVPVEAVAFGNDDKMRFVIEPHNFELKISEDVLRKSCCDGYTIDISNKGGVEIFDSQNSLVFAQGGTDKEYKQAKFNWEQDKLSVIFGNTVEIDNYPNCDGEHDRWSTSWVAEHQVDFDVCK